MWPPRPRAWPPARRERAAATSRAAAGRRLPPRRLSERPAERRRNRSPTGRRRGRVWRMRDAWRLLLRRAAQDRRLLDRGADARVGATATDIAGHRLVDFGVARMRGSAQQVGRRHDLPGLAIAT